MKNDILCVTWSLKVVETFGSYLQFGRTLDSEILRRHGVIGYGRRAYLDSILYKILKLFSLNDVI